MQAPIARSARSRNLDRLVLAGLGSALLIGPGACGSPTTTVEAGALLLRVTVSPGGGSKPEHLRLWTYDDGGLIFGAVRVPETGGLPAPGGDGALGTILIQPGTIRGTLRLHVRAFSGGARILDGVATATAAVVRAGKLDLALAAALPTDGDGDDVPDAIDDCLARANPAQGGCGPGADAGMDGAGTGGDAGAATDGADGGAGATGNGGSAGRSGSGGSSTGGAGGGAGSAGARTGGVGGAGAVGSGGIGTGGVGTGGARTGGMGTGGMGTGGARTGGMGTGGARTGGMGTGGAPKVLGVTCTNMNECASGFCVDGVCCESTCDTPCRTCATGRCLEVRRADDVPQCAGAMTCNNSARCAGD